LTVDDGSGWIMAFPADLRQKMLCGFSEKKKSGMVYTKQRGVSFEVTKYQLYHASTMSMSS
jgi:hypothetical protein